MSRERYRIGDLTVDVAAASVVRGDGEPVPLPQLSFDLLVALARRAPDVVSADELIAMVWNGTAVSDETLTQRVALLRRSLGDEAKSPRYLRAVRGRGYQLVPEVMAPPEEEEQQRPQPLGPSRYSRYSRPWLVSAAVVLALVAIGFLLYFLLMAYARGQTRSADAGTISTRTASVPELLSRAGSYLRQHQESDNELAIELYRRALRLEPENPLALAGLSLALAQRATKFNRGGEREQAVALAQKALSLDRRLGLAHHALGTAFDSKGQVSKALVAYLQAAEARSGSRRRARQRRLPDAGPGAPRRRPRRQRPPCPRSRRQQRCSHLSGGPDRLDAGAPRLRRSCGDLVRAGPRAASGQRLRAGSLRPDALVAGPYRRGGRDCRESPPARHPPAGAASDPRPRGPDERRRAQIQSLSFRKPSSSLQTSIPPRPAS